MAVNQLLEPQRTPHYRHPCRFPSYAIDRVNTACLPHSKLESLYDRSSASKVLTAERVTDAFGHLAVANTTWSGSLGYVSGFGFQMDRDAGLHLLGHRYYDSTTGRFLTRDRVKDGRNSYGSEVVSTLEGGVTP